MPSYALISALNSNCRRFKIERMSLSMSAASKVLSFALNVIE